MEVLRKILHPDIKVKLGLFFNARIGMLILIIVSQITFPAKGVDSEENLFELYIELNPIPKYNQLNVDQFYSFNLTLMCTRAFKGNDYSISQPKSKNDYFTLIITYEWWIKGTYSSGDSSSGYSTKVDSMNETHLIKALRVNQSINLSFNKTFVRDSFDLGAKPYEKIEVKLYAYVYPCLLNCSNNEGWQELVKHKKQFLLLDELKIDYVKGKFEDLKEELELLKNIPNERTSLDEENYLNFLTDMNQSLTVENYYDALGVYQDFERSRGDLLGELIYDLNNSLGELDKVTDLENRIQRLENDYINLEKDYLKLQEAYHLKTIQLDKQRQVTITLLAGVWVSAFVFFLIGRSSNRLKLNS